MDSVSCQRRGRSRDTLSLDIYKVKSLRRGAIRRSFIAFNGLVWCPIELILYRHVTCFDDYCRSFILSHLLFHR